MGKRQIPKQKISAKLKQKIVDDWIEHNGAADFDLKNRDIYLYDGGLFALIKEVKIQPRKRMVISKNPEIVKLKNGKELKSYPIKFIPIKRNGKILKEKVEYYKATFWFEELDETINYLVRMKKMLNSIGYNTTWQRKR